ncbi:iron ABC transporter [Afipia sp. P52-10]|jgi:iron complex transport system ATP-binding protein|uniref:heme ABC transporter ATP-binding protein n=1 Tax=Afipia sp. P52-10 TaxID=1429916 RepID=UPI0003DEFCC4|nr:heme ABC transporter ATP-binding protein [Afipia sp. P52-10]ETR76134.1 iron ABC transporter [Afipia sp. P52-10]
MSPAIEVSSAGMTIRGATLLDGIDFSAAPGETVAIVGPNGAGKSTLLRILSGDLLPTRGTVRIKGAELRSYAPDKLAAHRAVLSQHVTISFPFTVEEVVRMGAGEIPRAKAQPLVEAMLSEIDLNALRHRELPTLSGGEQQRAHFARVLLQLAVGEAKHGPGVLLLDEPTSSLDLRYQINLVELGKRRAKAGTAVIAILHDLNLASRFADRIVVLSKGRIAASGTPRETITSAMLRDVFEVETTIGLIGDLPHVLPQIMQPASGRL